jgi:hypothetical protein
MIPWIAAPRAVSGSVAFWSGSRSVGGAAGVLARDKSRRVCGWDVVVIREISAPRRRGAQGAARRKLLIYLLSIQGARTSLEVRP